MKIILITIISIFSINYANAGNLHQTEIPDTTEATDSTKSITTMVVPEGLTAEDVVDKYIEAIGGKDSLTAILDRTSILRGSVQGQSISIVAYQKAPDKLKQEIRSGAMKQEIIFDGQKGVMKAGENSTEITGNELEQLKTEASMYFLLNYPNLGVKLKLDGIEKVDSVDAYKVEFILPSGTIWTQFFDIESGLKIKEIKPVNTAQGTINQEMYLSDYRSVHGVRYPFKIVQSFGKQKLVFKVSSIKVNTGLKDSLFVIE